MLSFLDPFYLRRKPTGLGMIRVVLLLLLLVLLVLLVLLLRDQPSSKMLILSVLSHKKAYVMVRYDTPGYFATF